MFRRASTSWVLIASLLLGLWLAAAHDPNHEGLASHTETCAVCVFVGAVGGGIASAILVLALAIGVSLLAPAPKLVPRRTRRATIRVRGPPLILA